MNDLTLLTIANSPTKAAINYAADQLLEANEYLKEKNLSISKADAMEIAETRLTALKSNSRIEIGSGAATRILKKFSESAYVTNQNLPQILNFLCDTFYYLKTETRDKISDAELTAWMYDKFETTCQSPACHLSDECDKLIRRYNRGEPLFEDEDDDLYDFKKRSVRNRQSKLYTLFGSDNDTKSNYHRERISSIYKSFVFTAWRTYKALYIRRIRLGNERDRRCNSRFDNL